ncbi:MAG: ABC transporter ATP-binding protein [Chloroflexota bacterium]|nr:ABC transporter ATP-binding protein [Chloroflexota bacterium]
MKPISPATNGVAAHPPERSMIPAVEAVNLTRSLPLGGKEVAILNGVSFTTEPGEWIALTGPSGSGKSTLLGIIAGLDTPSSGTIRISGIDISRMDEGKLAAMRNKEIGIVFQSFNLIPSLTAQENVEVPLYVGSGHRKAAGKAAAMLDLVGLGDRRKHRPHQLSGGEQQRVAVARALVTEPSLLIADEPTGNLDSATGAQVLDLFSRLHANLKVTLVIATHDPAIAARADRVLHMIDGRLAVGRDQDTGTPVQAPGSQLPDASPETQARQAQIATIRSGSQPLSSDTLEGAHR